MEYHQFLENIEVASVDRVRLMHDNGLCFNFERGSTQPRRSFLSSKADIEHYQSMDRYSFSATSSMGSKDLKVVFTW
jgi:hypothetical protein